MRVMRQAVWCAVVVAALAVAASPAEAGFFRNGFGLTGPDVTIRFDELALASGTFVDDEYAAFGITFTPGVVQYNAVGSPFAGISGGYVGNFGTPAPPPIMDPFSIHFSSPVSAAAFALATNISTGPADFTTFAPYLNGVLVAGPATAYVHNSLAAFAFIGFEGAIFDEIRLNIQGNGAMILDNFQFNRVPEPATLSLLGMATLGMLARARRRKTSAQR
jgi:hypothetical protein